MIIIRHRSILCQQTAVGRANKGTEFLSLKGSGDAVSNLHVRDAERGRSLSDYWPLVSLVVVSALAAFAIAVGSGKITMTSVMHAYMGVFLVFFALLKIFDLEGFMNGFAMYDLIAKRNSTWGYVYPFIEFALGLAYLAFLWPTATYIATIIVFTFGAVGVVLALRRGLDIACPCMGTVLSVPLSTVTLTEDVLMVAMAIMLLMEI